MIGARKQRGLTIPLHLIAVAGGWLLLATNVQLAAGPASSERAADRPPAPSTPAGKAPAPETAPPPVTQVPIVAPGLPEEPAAGKGRLAIILGGNRRWCTSPDDRVVKPPEERSQRPRKGGNVYTFGYKFTISAIRRGAADTPLMLFESPVFRTASWRPASKVGGAAPRRRGGLADRDLELPPNAGKPRGDDPTALVPFWQGTYRCTSVPERFEFDLEPGSYDVYMAFDLLNRDNSWVHRSAGYLTEVEVQEGRRTRLDGVVDLGQGGRRDVDLRSFMVLPESGPAGGGRP